MAQFGSIRLTPSKVQQIMAAGKEQLSPEEFEELTDLGCDAFGEDGEYHTLVVDGPIFLSPLLVRFGDERHEEDHWFLDVVLA